jgi:N-methylhydantoinase B/oxoprolinase/acetone carboxylase alpha subunit|tara:strand:+ start:3653 stop:3895 length:243 start_codon:yes stop_codon:yes gene_type:complete
MSVHDKLNKLIEKYGSDNEESLVEHLKSKFSKEYKLAIADLKKDGSDDPDMEMTAGRIADHVGNNDKNFLSECEKILSNS